MKNWLLIFAFISSTITLAQGQQVLKGVVLELNGNSPISQVSIKNIETGISSKSIDDGTFQIAVKINDRLRFEQIGFKVDTVVVTEYEYKRVYLSEVSTGAIELTEVQVRAMTDNQLQREINEAEKQGKVAGTVYGGGIAISPSRWFGSSGKAARYKYRMLKREEENRKIDARFNEALISSLIPLKGDELTAFIAAYRPKLNFIEKSDDEQLKLYVVDSYADFKKKQEKGK
ncbi:hypothetical protein SAMN05216436_10250 [bacterium A37T11]|nr:hypothetical protein SAMN05216436_10250 [bacterium A37T11]